MGSIGNAIPSNFCICLENKQRRVHCHSKCQATCQQNSTCGEFKFTSLILRKVQPKPIVCSPRLIPNMCHRLQHVNDGLYDSEEAILTWKIKSGRSSSKSWNAENWKDYSLKTQSHYATPSNFSSVKKKTMQKNFASRCNRWWKVDWIMVQNNQARLVNPAISHHKRLNQISAVILRKNCIRMKLRIALWERRPQCDESHE